MSVAPLERPLVKPPPIAGREHAPELQLLLCCARRELTPENAAQISKLLRQPIDWERLAPLAQTHGLLPLLHWHLGRNFASEFPVQVRSVLHDTFHSNARRNLLLVGEIIRVIELLNGHGVRVIPFKGPAAAELLYGNIALRECADLDFLLPRRDVSEAIRVLTSNGYEPARKLTSVQQRALLGAHYEFGCVSPAGTLIELQWRIVPKYFSLRFEEEQYWRNIRRITLCGRDIPALSPEDLLLLFCFHGCKHRWTSLIWLADVGELVNANPHLDWEYVLHTARQAGGMRMLRLGLILAGRLLHAAIPDEVGHMIQQDQGANQLADEICGDFIRGRPRDYVKSQLYLLKLRERWRDRVRHVLRFVFTSTPMEWTIVHFPRPLFAGYSLLRVLRGFVKGLSLAITSMSRFVRARL